jgi:hypothetical protein
VTVYHPPASPPLPLAAHHARRAPRRQRVVVVERLVRVCVHVHVHVAFATLVPDLALALEMRFGFVRAFQSRLGGGRAALVAALAAAVLRVVDVDVARVVVGMGALARGRARVMVLLGPIVVLLLILVLLRRWRVLRVLRML